MGFVGGEGVDDGGFWEEGAQVGEPEGLVAVAGSFGIGVEVVDVFGEGDGWFHC